MCMIFTADTRLLRLNDFLFFASVDNVNLFKVKLAMHMHTSPICDLYLICPVYRFWNTANEVKYLERWVCMGEKLGLLIASQMFLLLSQWSSGVGTEDGWFMSIKLNDQTLVLEVQWLIDEKTLGTPSLNSHFSSRCFLLSFTKWKKVQGLTFLFWGFVLWWKCM